MKPYYQQDGIIIYHGDCREILPGLKADLILTDPPYGTQNLSGGYGRRQNWDKGDGLGRTIQGDESLEVFKQAWPVMAACVENGWAQVFFSARKTPEFIAAAAGAGEWMGEIIWDKGSPGLGYHVRYAHENIALFKIGEPARPPNPLLSILRAGRIARLHPHEKPIEVMTALAAWGCREGGIIIDPFMGGGTSLAAAKLLKRMAIGIEIEECYCEIAALRLSQQIFNFSGAAQ